MVLRMRRKHRRRRDTQQAHHTTHKWPAISQDHPMRWFATDISWQIFKAWSEATEATSYEEKKISLRPLHPLSSWSPQWKTAAGNNLVNTGWFDHNLCKQDKMWTIKPYPDIEVGVLKEKIGKWESQSICRNQVLSFDEKMGWFNKWQIFWNIWQKIFQVFFTPLQRVVAERVSRSFAIISEHQLWLLLRWFWQTNY